MQEIIMMMMIIKHVLIGITFLCHLTAMVTKNGTITLLIWNDILFSFFMCSRENDSNVFCVHEMWLSSYNDTWKIRDSRRLHKPAFKPHRLAITIPVSLIYHVSNANL
jgi:hypothetical protein